MKGRILVADDDPSFGKLLEADLGRRGYHVRRCLRAEAALEALGAEDFDAVLTDMRMPGMGGIAFCERAGGTQPDVPVIVVTAFGSLETAIDAMRAGAYDFVTKPIEMDLLDIALRRAVQHRRLNDEVRRLNERVGAQEGMGPILGESVAMQKLFDQIARVASTDASVLITGQSGTGKELVARALHGRSARRDGAFVVVNCPALPETLLEGELFGHARGAFTGAHEAKEGLLAQADGGTLFLDEIGDFPLALQPKLLRCLEERTFRPLGANREVSFDARIVAATNQDLETAVEEGGFREDLYYRLNVVQLRLPPLCSRGADVLTLAQHFVERFAERHGKSVKGFAKPAAAKLLEYAWPGNVRELRNAVERAVALARFDQITVEDLPRPIRAYRRRQVVVAGEDPGALQPLDDVVRRYVHHVLDAVAGNKTEAARILGIDRKTLYRKLRE